MAWLCKTPGFNDKWFDPKAVYTDAVRRRTESKLSHFQFNSNIESLKVRILQWLNYGCCINIITSSSYLTSLHIFLLILTILLILAFKFFLYVNFCPKRLKLPSTPAHYIYFFSLILLIGFKSFLIIFLLHIILSSSFLYLNLESSFFLSHVLCVRRFFVLILL